MSVHICKCLESWSVVSQDDILTARCFSQKVACGCAQNIIIAQSTGNLTYQQHSLPCQACAVCMKARTASCGDKRDSLAAQASRPSLPPPKAA